MNEDVFEIVEMLELLLEEDLSSKVRVELSSIISNLKGSNSSEDLMKVQDSLELISSSAQLDDFTRNEIINVVAILEGMYNS